MVRLPIHLWEVGRFKTLYDSSIYYCTSTSTVNTYMYSCTSTVNTYYHSTCTVPVQLYVSSLYDSSIYIINSINGLRVGISVPTELLAKLGTSNTTIVNININIT